MTKKCFPWLLLHLKIVFIQFWTIYQHSKLLNFLKFFEWKTHIFSLLRGHFGNFKGFLCLLLFYVRFGYGFWNTFLAINSVLIVQIPNHENWKYFWMPNFTLLYSQLNFGKQTNFYYNFCAHSTQKIVKNYIFREDITDGRKWPIYPKCPKYYSKYTKWCSLFVDTNNLSTFWFFCNFFSFHTSKIKFLKN